MFNTKNTISVSYEIRFDELELVMEITIRSKMSHG
jgi:hypothetical protein